MSINAKSSVKYASMAAVVIRCTCEDKTLHPGEVCPQGTLEDLGIIAEYKPLKTRIKEWLHFK